MVQHLWGHWLLVGMGALSTGIANVLLKKSRLVATDPGLLALVSSPWFIGALFFYCLDLLLFAKALDRLPVAIALPVFFGIMLSAVLVLSNVFLAERLTANQLVALGLISAGIVIMSQK
ncbi:SMR family transporter [Pseudanabaena sp. FACHB-2040]|uniref:DMT family transporter n=1 Tax=Pseudanabaena sp. FACHB-2040 TaxID=2692859 RepID=UPI001689AD71|nr:SMR family transporter [Pseudanabaena sp. FACHB-2040]MBD2258532.1 small multidrug resistance protein [Pseudanabaena sp. FACHB-2040]